MVDFLEWHPSSKRAEQLYAKRLDIAKQIFNNPFQGISSLREEWKFGSISEIWDDFVFETCVRSALDLNLNVGIKDAIRRYSLIDHALFLPYIRRQEDPIRFRRAFWNVNFYGIRIAQRISREIAQNKYNIQIKNASTPNTIPKILFILKGGYKLAHVEFLHSFLSGCSIFSKKVNISLLLIDDFKDTPKDLNHVSITSLNQYGNDSFKKINAYVQYCLANNFDHICWVAPIQNISLYMGMQLAPCQSYWSMKYHSIIMPTLQKYAGLGFGGKSFTFDEVFWFRGRAFPDLLMPKTSPLALEKLKRKHSIPNKSLVVGCFVRSEKLYEQSFWNSICKIIKSPENVHFVIASQSIPTSMMTFINKELGELVGHFHHLGWVNTKEWASNLDVYYDSCPRGSCNTTFEAIEKSVPVLIYNSSHNRESSALPYLISAIAANEETTFNSIGIYSREEERLSECLKLLSSNERRATLASRQKKIINTLKGKNYLFAKDYLNYFLDSNLTLKEL